jgi:hypothetical protein
MESCNQFFKIDSILCCQHRGGAIIEYYLQILFFNFFKIPFVPRKGVGDTKSWRNLEALESYFYLENNKKIFCVENSKSPTENFRGGGIL